MPTYTYSKKDFINFIEKQVKDDEIIVLTNEKTGNLSTSKKKGLQVNHAYAPEVFSEEGVGHIAFGETTSLGILIANEKRISEAGKKAMELQKS